MLTPAGRRLSRRAPKDPVRVASGKRAAASDAHYAKAGIPVRSSHFGYDCYFTGPVSSTGKTRIILRAGRLPPHLPPDAKLMMPTEMWWPERDHRAAHGLIDSVISYELGALENWKASWPGHDFGFDQFLELARRRKAAVRTENIPDVPKIPQRLDPAQAEVSVMGSAPLPRQLALFPADVIALEPYGGSDTDTYCVRLHLVRFADGQAALRVSVGGRLPDGKLVLGTRAYVDLMDGRFEIIEHYPGRLKALGLPSTLLHRILDVPEPKAVQRHEPPKPERSRLRASDRTIMAARKIQAVIASGDPTAEASREPLSRPEPVRVMGNGRYNPERDGRPDDPSDDQLDEQRDIDPEQFPDAPGT